MTNHTGALTGRRILFVLPPSRFDEAEFYQAFQMLTEEGAWISVATESETGIAVGESGARERATAQISDIKARDYDAVLLVGGAKGDGLVQCAALPDLLYRASRRGTVIAAFREATGLPLLGLESGKVVIGTVKQLPRFVAEIAVRLAKKPMPQVEATA